MDVPHIMTFGDLREYLAELKGFPVETTRLVFAGRQLERDRAFMDESGMQKGTTIHCINTEKKKD